MSILDLTSAHLEGYEPGAPIHIANLPKFKIIAKLFLILVGGDSKPYYAQTGRGFRDKNMASRLYYDPATPSAFATLQKVRDAVV